MANILKIKKNKPNYIYIVYIYICKPYSQKELVHRIYSPYKEKKTNNQKMRNREFF